MTKLWDKGISLNATVEDYTVGNDYVLDKDLLAYDVAGSIAHARMLGKIGVLSGSEVTKLVKALKEITGLREFEIKKQDEDVHTAIENYLVKKLGETGKKIHAGRSRNDQVLVATRLYTKDRLIELMESAASCAETLGKFAEKNRDVPIVGRTHTQKAMPSSVGLWAGAHAEALLDDLKLLEAAYELADQNPLGSAAAYGSALPIDREYTAKLLGFSKVQNNVLYCANSRGKVEAAVLSACSQVMLDLSRIAADVIFWSIPETGYFKLPDELFSGSSLMPQKKNPCALELARGNAAVVFGYLAQVYGITAGLISGYNRDVQLTKEPLMRGLSVTKATLGVVELTIKKLKVDEKKCLAAFTPEVFATDEALRLVGQGVAFRDAYKRVAGKIKSLNVEDPVKNIKGKKHAGATGNLGLSSLLRKAVQKKAAARKASKSFKKKLESV
ncbi:MAG: argininosuccinate lyase [Candidatus Altiarchaeota archaeon]